MSALGIRAVPGLDEIREGEPLGTIVAEAARDSGDPLEDGEVLVVSQKVVSKAEGRIRRLADVEPGAEARALAARVGKDPRLVELILGESSRVVRAEPGVLIVEIRAGWTCANAGIDASNVPGEDAVALLPEDADASARRLRAEVREHSGASPAVIVADSFGRPWRLGQTDVAIGCAGLVALEPPAGRRDREGRPLAATAPAIADEAAAAADLVRSKDSGIPAVVIAGLERHVTGDDGPGAAVLRRAAARDLFR